MNWRVAANSHSYLLNKTRMNIRLKCNFHLLLKSWKGWFHICGSHCISTDPANATITVTTILWSIFIKTLLVYICIYMSCLSKVTTFIKLRIFCCHGNHYLGNFLNAKGAGGTPGKCLNNLFHVSASLKIKVDSDNTNTGHCVCHNTRLKLIQLWCICAFVRRVLLKLRWMRW